MEDMYITLGVAFIVGGGIGYIIGLLDGTRVTKKIYSKAMADLQFDNLRWKPRPRR